VVSEKRKICVVIGSRANYASIKSALRSIQQHPALTLQIITNTSAVLDRYGEVHKIIQNDGFPINQKMYTLVEGETLSTMAKSTGLALLELPTILEQLKPDIVVTIGDRFETMATTIAAAYMNIPLAHTMGGEVSGNIDENIRHAITKFANIHFPACDDAKQRIIRLGENEDRIFMVGCPRIDIVAEILEANKEDQHAAIREGVGADFDPSNPFLLISQHPVTSDYGKGEDQITDTLEAALELNLPAIVLWPNADAGSEEVSRGMRKFREKHYDAPFRYVKNLQAEIYLPLMRQTACLVGNSSSAIREGAFIGTPSVNIGTRQVNRQRGQNVIDVSGGKEQIKQAIQNRIAHGKFVSEPIYGDGKAGARIADVLAKVPLNIEKYITY
jgi:UDP-hydrolysing UDP-N-acetyl-D-glucosamine 2-epimerase